MAIADRYDAFLLDLDGTLYRGSKAIPSAPATVERLRSSGKRTVFLTNNSGRTTQQIVAKLREFGIDAGEEEVVSSAVATAELVAAEGYEVVYAVCGDGLRRALADRNVRVLDGSAERVDAVVVGWDRRVTYDRLKQASLLVQRGAALIASNADPAYPAEDGLWPGAGALLAVITTTTGATPLVVGKPNAPLFETALRRAGGGRPLVVGDRLDTDIGGADRLGWDSLLVFTGVSGPEDLAQSKIRPTWVAPEVGAIFAEPEPEWTA